MNRVHHVTRLAGEIVRDKGMTCKYEYVDGGFYWVFYRGASPISKTARIKKVFHFAQKLVDEGK